MSEPQSEVSGSEAEARKRWKWDISLKVIEILVIVASVTAASALGIEQLKKVDASLVSSDESARSNTAAIIYAQQQEINQIFAEDPNLQKYFWYGDEAPGGPRDPSKPAAVASRVLDHFEHLIFQLESGKFSEEKFGWEAYMKRSFRESPVLCHTLLEDIDEYGNKEPGSMWDLYAKDSCPAT